MSQQLARLESKMGEGERRRVSPRVVPTGQVSTVASPVEEDDSESAEDKENPSYTLSPSCFQFKNQIDLTDEQNMVWLQQI